MNKPHLNFSISECKVKASILLKQLYSSNPDEIEKAKKRFLRLQDLSDYTIITLDVLKIKRKHALAVIALEKGFSSWSELRFQLPMIKGGFLNHWFSSYEAAKEYQKKTETFLFPYQNQFFVADANYIKHLGFNPEDADWQLIGRDFKMPLNKEAWERLHSQWMLIIGEQK